MTPADYATAAAIAVLGSLAWWYATHAGKDEAEQIARNIALNINEDLPHDELLMQRIGTIGVVWVVLWMFLGAIMVIALKSHWSDGVLIGVPLAALAWAMFTLRHRYALNRARTHFPWFYVADGNVYDRVYLNITGGRVKAAGLLAYAFEVLVAAGAVVLAMWIA